MKLTPGSVIAALSVATLVTALLAYRDRTPLARILPDDPGADAAAARSIVTAPSAPVDSLAATAADRGHPLQDYLLSMQTLERNSVLHSMLRDASFACTELIGAMQMADDTAAWRISCENAHAYVLAVNALGEVQIDPVSYSEGARQNPLDPNILAPQQEQ
jgi:hypothetical protein